MARPAVPPIEGLGVDTVELAHPPRQVRLRGLNQQVVVVVHQAVGMAEPPIAGDDLAEGLEKDLATRVVPEDLLPGVPPGGEMIDRTRIFDSEGPRHERRLTE